MLLDVVNTLLVRLSLFTADSLASWRQEQYSQRLQLLT